jgi:light-independent protochlorophyllide reductase subunit N
MPVLRRSAAELGPEAEDAPASLMVVGALPDVVEDQFRRLFAALGIEHVSFLPARQDADMPRVGPTHTLLLAQPFMTAPLKALTDRGAQLIEAPFPFGAEGTTAWLRSAADAFGARISSILSPPRPKRAPAKVA